MVKKILIVIIFFIPFVAYSQSEPADEIEIDINTYFDNFRLNVIYPYISVTKNVGNNTTINGSYLADAISSASMKMIFRVDGITSATANKTGGADNTPDELRHQLSFGITKIFSEISVSANGMYSIEHDYSSKTFAANLSIPFAKKNTILQLGYAGNWDKVFPQVRTWTKDRNTLTVNLGLTQILSKKIVTQLDFSFINMTGYMLDGYQVVRIISDSTFKVLEPIEPDLRIRKSAGLRTNIGITKISTLQLDYRYYWDTWDINSHTINIEYKTHLTPLINMSLGFRNYFQTKAYFFKPVYTEPEPFMGVDSKLNSGYTNDVSVGFLFKGDKNINFPLLNNDRYSLIINLGLYHRHTDSPDWAIKLSDLYAYLFTLGFKLSI